MSAAIEPEKAQEVLGIIHQCILTRNATETAPFASVFESNVQLQVLVDDLQYRCEVMERTRQDQSQQIEKVC